MNMYLLTNIVVLMILVATPSSVVEAGKREIIDEAVKCVLRTLPREILFGADLFTKHYMINISSQWDPLNPHDYLMWPVYDGPEAWAASCHVSSTLKRCLEPIYEYKIKLQPPLTLAETSPLTSAMYFTTLCEHQSTLTDPITNNAECVHQRMLSDDVQRCMGVLGWLDGNFWLIVNKNLPEMLKSISNTVSSVYECIYERGNWRHSCGSEVEAMMGSLAKKFSNLAKLTYRVIVSSMLTENICDICAPGSNLTTYSHLATLRNHILRSLLLNNQSPYLFTQCKVVNYPLNQCHLRLIWRRDVYNMFCHYVMTVFIPEVTPHLPICDFGDWVRSAARICNMGYDRFMDMASHIARCTKDQDELFPCYKGLKMGLFSWGLVSAGRMWQYDTDLDGSKLRIAYNRIKTCVPRLYDHLRQTCRHGPPVVRLIQDLRTVLMIDVPAIFSWGLVWRSTHFNYMTFGIHVDQC